MNNTAEDREMMRIVSRRLKWALFEADMSCAQLHRVTGISESTVYNIVNQRTVPSATKVKKIADALNVSADWLLGRTDEKGERHGNN